MTTYACIDTNTLLHYEPLPGLPWPELLPGGDVVLVLAIVVIDELDRHKNGGVPRLRKRADKVLRWLEPLLLAEGDDVIAEAVRLDVRSQDPMVDFKQHGLDPSRGDCRLLASMIEFKAEKPDAVVVLVTADASLKLRARPRHIICMTPPERYKLPPIEGTDAAKNRARDEKLRRLEAATPKLGLRAEQEPITRTIRFFVTGFDFTDELAYARRATNQTTPDYHSDYSAYLAGLEAYRQAEARCVMFGLQIENTGLAPAIDVRVALRCVGQFLLLEDTSVPSPPTRLGVDFTGSRWGRQDSPLLPQTVVGYELDAQGVTVHLAVAKLQQTESHDLGPVRLYPASFEHAVGFPIHYSLIADNIPTPITGTINVRVEKEPNGLHYVHEDHEPLWTFGFFL